MLSFIERNLKIGVIIIFVAIGLFFCNVSNLLAEEISPDDPLPKNAHRQVSDLYGQASDLYGSVSNLEASVSSLSTSSSSIAGNQQDIVTAKDSLAEGDSDLSRNLVKITETADEIKINIASDVLFDFNRWGIRPTATAALQQVAEVLKKHSKLAVVLTGHTDSIGSTEYNQELSLQRAKSVEAWLIHKSSAYEIAMKTVGRGESQPVAANNNPDGTDNPQGRQQNRRVELRLDKRMNS